MSSIHCALSDLIGQTCTKVVADDDEVSFFTKEGNHYSLRHQQDCCESVWIEDVIGDLQDLVGSPVVMSEEVHAEDLGPVESEYSDTSYTWTFFKFATLKGYVTVRFYGTSNGYYSETADFYKVTS